jgi:hypothetical protein
VPLDRQRLYSGLYTIEVFLSCGQSEDTASRNFMW